MPPPLLTIVAFAAVLVSKKLLPLNIRLVIVAFAAVPLLRNVVSPPLRFVMFAVPAEALS